MIKELRLENFRGFDDHRIPFNPRTIVVVGKNNAGKSTIVEALRLVALIAPGKQMISALSDWSQKNFGVSFNATKLASFLQETEIHPEMRAVVEAIESHDLFPARQNKRVI